MADWAVDVDALQAAALVGSGPADGAAATAAAAPPAAQPEHEGEAEAAAAAEAAADAAAALASAVGPLALALVPQPPAAVAPAAVAGLQVALAPAAGAGALVMAAPVGGASTMRCLASHASPCFACREPPAPDEDCELAGDAGKKNGEKMLRSLITSTPEWRHAGVRRAASEAADRAGLTRLAGALRDKQSATLRKADLLELCRVWRYRCHIWQPRAPRLRKPGGAEAAAAAAAAGVLSGGGGGRGGGGGAKRARADANGGDAAAAATAVAVLVAAPAGGAAAAPAAAPAAGDGVGAAAAAAGPPHAPAPGRSPDYSAGMAEGAAVALHAASLALRLLGSATAAALFEGPPAHQHQPQQQPQQQQQPLGGGGGAVASASCCGPTGAGLDSPLMFLYLKWAAAGGQREADLAAAWAAAAAAGVAAAEGVA